MNEPAALKVATQLVSLARWLRREGFEPTTIAAMTELDQGVEVLGRANEDAMVAVTLAKAPPWIVTYTDGPEWSLEGVRGGAGGAYGPSGSGEPRIVPIKPLQRVTLRATNPKTLPPKDKRHTVVFRRQAGLGGTLMMKR